MADVDASTAKKDPEVEKEVKTEAESPETTEKRERVGLRGWLRGTAQKGLRNVGAGVVNNVIWTAGNARQIAGQVLNRSGTWDKNQFKDYQGLATYLENLIQTETGKARIESVHYLSEILKFKAPNYDSLSQSVPQEVESPLLVINEGGANEEDKNDTPVDFEGNTIEGEHKQPQNLNLEDNPLKALATVSVPPLDVTASVLDNESDREKSLQGVREVFLNSKALELAGMALMKCKPASEWENVAYRGLFRACILLNLETKDDYCEALLKTASRISEVWETVQLQSNEGNDAGEIKGVIEKLMEIVCSTICELKLNPKIESIRKKIDSLTKQKADQCEDRGFMPSDPFMREKESVRISRELCDLVGEQQKLVETLMTKDDSTQRQETQKFLAVKAIELTDDLSSKSSQIKDTAEQKSKAQKYREKKLNDLTESSSSAQTKCEELKKREEKLKEELELVKADIVKEESHIADLAEEIKLVEESSAEVIGSLTFAESELKVRHNMLTASLKAMDSVQDFFTDFIKKESGWSAVHNKSFVGLANNDCHSAQGNLFHSCVSHLELCVQEGNRLLKQIQFCESELKTMRERALQMESLGLMEGANQEGEDIRGNIEDFSFVEQGLSRIQAQHDKAVATLETIIDDGLKTCAILDSEGVKDVNSTKFKMLVERMNDFSTYLKGSRAQAAGQGPSDEDEEAADVSENLHLSEDELTDQPHEISKREVKPDEDSVEEYIEYLEHKLVPGNDHDIQTEVMLTTPNDSSESSDKETKDKEKDGDEQEGTQAEEEVEMSEEPKPEKSSEPPPEESEELPEETESLEQGQEKADQ